MGQPERKKPHREVALRARCVSDTKRQSAIATAAPKSEKDNLVNPPLFRSVHNKSCTETDKMIEDCGVLSMYKKNYLQRFV